MTPDQIAFPALDAEELALLRPHAQEQSYADRDTIFRAGERDLDLIVVLTGGVAIINPTDNNALVTTHTPGHFCGDIDLLTRRPVIVTAVADGSTTILRVPNAQLRRVLNSIPRLGEKLLRAFQVRRQLLQQSGVLGIKIIGPGDCRDTNIVREFLHKNFVPFTWYDTATPAGQSARAAIGNPTKTPAIVCNDGRVLLNPSLRDLAKCAGVWADCPNRTADLAIVGAGPAGISAAVYAASEGVDTIVLDRLGPGGQAGGSSKIENFIGFPAGLSGADLATRGVLQMLKFGAQMIAPIAVDRLEPAASETEPHILHLDCGAKLRAHTVLVSVGVNWRRLAAKGMDRFEHAGIYYACTRVEADLHTRSDVAVVGAGNSAGQAAMFLAEQNARCVHMIVRSTLGPGMSEYLASRIRNTPNIKVHETTEVQEVFGDARISSIDLLNTKSKEVRRLKVSGLFVFIGAEPQVSWLPDTIGRDKLGYLLTGVDAERSGLWPLKNRAPCALETTIPRVLAAGDVRSGSTKRVGFAVGDGSLAVTCVHRLKTIQT